MKFQKNSAVVSLKEMIIILGSLAIANGVIALLTINNSIIPLARLLSDPISVLFFVSLIFNIVRFYLGNTRIIDDSYLSNFYSVPSDGTSRVKYLPFDYLVILLTGIFLALLSFYVRDHFQYTVVFFLMLCLDVFWLLITRKASIDKNINRQRTWWALNNFGCIMFIGLGFVIARENAIYFLVVISFNTIIDFALSYRFYFYPVSTISRENPKIFLAAPFTQYLKEGVFDPEVKTGLESIYNNLLEDGYQVFSAHTKEDWGKDLDAPPTALPRDLNELSDCDLLVAFIGSPASPGVQMEIGAAIILRKPIIYLVERGKEAPYLLNGLSVVTKSQLINYKTFEDASKQVLDLVNSLHKNYWLE